MTQSLTELFVPLFPTPQIGYRRRSCGKSESMKPARQGIAKIKESCSSYPLKALEPSKHQLHTLNIVIQVDEFEL